MRHTYCDPGFDLQTPFDAAVVIPSILRPELPRALRSVFAQDLAGRIQVLVGVDKPLGDGSVIAEACKDRPSNVAVSVLDLGYSTSARHGGVNSAADGGSLRAILSFLANSRYITYLDDDDWWAPDHLSSLRAAIEGHHYSYTLRWLVDAKTLKLQCIDEWNSVGPDKGLSATEGGFVGPTSLMIDKLECLPVLCFWSQSPGDPGLFADRLVFHALRWNFRGNGTGRATAYYALRPDHPLWRRISKRTRSRQDGVRQETIVPRPHSGSTVQQTICDLGFDLQRPFDAAVVMPSILRPELARALRSVYEQDLAGRIQVLVGIDKPLGDRAVIEEACRGRASNVAVSVLDLGYSTSVRHGGVHNAADGGSLRAILSFLANTRYIAYLDDDNLWSPNHLSSLLAAIKSYQYAFSLRWFIDDETLEPICIDEWHSVGPNRGKFKATFGGFIDPNTLMIDKIECLPMLYLWSQSPGNPGVFADRLVFDALRNNFRGIGTERATSYYTIGADGTSWQVINESRSARGLPPLTRPGQT